MLTHTHPLYFSVFLTYFSLASPFSFRVTHTLSQCKLSLQYGWYCLLLRRVDSSSTLRLYFLQEKLNRPLELNLNRKKKQKEWEEGNCSNISTNMNSCSLQPNSPEIELAQVVLLPAFIRRQFNNQMWANLLWFPLLPGSKLWLHFDLLK